MPAQWSPTTWQSFPATQQPVYPDPAALNSAVAQLSALPPLVTSWEIENLKSQLAEAALGKRFLLQGGDCAESFDDCQSTTIANKLKILLQMSLILVHGTKRRVIRVGRFAGQYAKPRTNNTESRNGHPHELPAYRGDLVNRAEFSAAARTPDPQLLLRGYERAALTINFIRALIDGGFADLHHPEYWDLGFMRHSPRAAEYKHMIDEISRSLAFLETLAGSSLHDINRVDFYTSHEGLHLHYEQAQTRTVPRRPGWYNLSTHFPWLGMRTALPDSAHLEYFRGIANPIAIKIGTPESLHESPADWSARITSLLETLHPANEPGRITIIHRFGAHHIAAHLPALIRAVQSTNKTVLWCCDPMHGNTQTVADGPAQGLKTRKFEHIMAELDQAFEIHRAHGTYLGGVHFELTGENVTECTGGARNLSESDLTRAYKSQVDPRLNYEQSLEMAMLIAKKVL